MIGATGAGERYKLLILRQLRLFLGCLVYFLDVASCFSSSSIFPRTCTSIIEGRHDWLFQTPPQTHPTTANMVHINRVATHKEVSEEQSQFEAIDATTTINLTPDDEADDYTATVYGSKYAAEDLPRHEMPVSPALLSSYTRN